jgi:hypothetical protein
MNCGGRLDSEIAEPGRRAFYGKYRGTVINNIDPEFRGRLMVEVADVFGPGFSSWALPCLPFGGMQAGVYLVPPMQSQVWVEFENGDSDYPIWVGAFWGGPGSVPSTSKLTTAPPPGQNVVIQTMGQTVLSLSDAPTPLIGGITLKTLTSLINVTDSMITIKCGTTQLVITPAGIKVDSATMPGALLVT